jgi:hypothetical protein
MTKLLFLDIDGVMVSWAPDRDRAPMKLEDGDEAFDEPAVANLNKLLTDHPDLRIVVSSTWRGGKSIDKLNEIFENRGVIPGRIVGKTPYMYFQISHDGSNPMCTVPRGCEIQAYLMDYREKHDGKSFSYCIIDDSSDMLYWHKDHFLHVDGSRGFSYTKMVEEVDKILRRVTVI